MNGRNLSVEFSSVATSAQSLQIPSMPKEPVPPGMKYVFEESGAAGKKEWLLVENDDENEKPTPKTKIQAPKGKPLKPERQRQ